MLPDPRKVAPVDHDELKPLFGGQLFGRNHTGVKNMTCLLATSNGQIINHALPHQHMRRTLPVFRLVKSDYLFEAGLA